MRVCVLECRRVRRANGEITRSRNAGWLLRACGCRSVRGVEPDRMVMVEDGDGDGDGGRGILTKASQEDEGRDGELGASRPTVGRRRRCGGGGGCMARYILMDMDRRRTRPRSTVHGGRTNVCRTSAERRPGAGLLGKLDIATAAVDPGSACTVHRAPCAVVRRARLHAAAASKPRQPAQEVGNPDDDVPVRASRNPEPEPEPEPRTHRDVLRIGSSGGNTHTKNADAVQ